MIGTRGFNKVLEAVEGLIYLVATAVTQNVDVFSAEGLTTLVEQKTQNLVEVGVRMGETVEVVL